MATKIVKDAAAVDQTFTLLSADSTKARWSPLAVNTATDIRTITVEQKVPALGSSASHRVIVKCNRDKIATGADGKSTVKTLYVSILLSSAPEFTSAEQDEVIAFALNYFSNNKADLKNGVVA